MKSTDRTTFTPVRTARRQRSEAANRDLNDILKLCEEDPAALEYLRPELNRIAELLWPADPIAGTEAQHKRLGYLEQAEVCLRQAGITLDLGLTIVLVEGLARMPLESNPCTNPKGIRRPAPDSFRPSLAARQGAMRKRASRVVPGSPRGRAGFRLRKPARRPDRA